MYARNIALIAVLIAVIVGAGWLYHSGVQAERDKAELAQLKKFKDTSDKLAALSTKYNKLKAQKEKVREVIVTRENRLIDENPSYYAGDCFDADSLQHIRDSQLSR